MKNSKSNPHKNAMIELFSGNCLSTIYCVRVEKSKTNFIVNSP